MSYLISLGVGLVVGVAYALIGVRSPAPPLVALAGLLGMVGGEQLVPLVKHWVMQQSDERRQRANDGTAMNSAVVRAAQAIATLPAIRFIALLGLCAAYLQGGIDKVLDFPGAVAEVQHFGLAPALPIAVATIVTEFAGPALVLSGRLRWLADLVVKTIGRDPR